ncbi:hypothetical protein LTR85_008481 [Meristemomyces frigidus]|nr:hypothetical protein LTR85_008481 [Meristemomyces frigidus]
MATHSYPQFSDGDVEIHLSTDPSDKYILHSYVLALHSPWFKASISERWNSGGTGNTSFIGIGGSSAVGGKSRWIYELHFDEDSQLGMLVKKATTPRATQMISSSHTKLHSDSPNVTIRLHAERIGSAKAHQDMLGTLYHLAPAFSHENFENAKASILLLANVADIYGCQHVTKMHIESHLRLYRTEVLELCAKDPLDMLELAMAVKSEWIFMEAATNLIGRSKRFFESSQLQLSKLGIADLMDTKRTELREKLQACEYEMFRMQPVTTEDWKHIVAINYFRQWLSERLKDGQGSELAPGYGDLYHSICSTSASVRAARKPKVLDFTTILFNNAAETINELMPSVNTAFDSAAAIVQPLRQDTTRRQSKHSDMHRSLTFMGIGDEELPWVKK